MKGKRNIFTSIGSIIVVGLIVVDRIVLGESVHVPSWITIPLIIISVILVGIGVFINVKQNNAPK